MTEEKMILRLRDLAVVSNDGVLRGPALGAADRIEALVKERDDYYERWNDCQDKRMAAESALAAEKARNARLVEAAEPFKRMAAEMFARNWNKDDVAIALDNPDAPNRLTFADFLALHAALTQKDRTDAQ